MARVSRLGGDMELSRLIQAETDRQQRSLQLLAGENVTSPATLEALATPLANKYAEGYPGQRRHNGCEIVDQVERLATERAKKLFKCGYANVQPYAGTIAVLAAYWVLLNPGDKVLALSRAAGGHFTYGLPSSISGHTFDFSFYGLRKDTETIDYDQVRDLARAQRPRAIVAGAVTYPRIIDYSAFRQIADEVGAFLIVDAAHEMGLIAGGVVPNPVPFADVVCGVTHKTLRGPRGGLLLSSEIYGPILDQAVYPLMQGGPHLNTIAAKAAAFGEAATSEFAEYTRQIVSNSRALATSLADQGLRIVTGGTDTHQIIADVEALNISNRDVRDRCNRDGIVLDVLSLRGGDNGIRLGTSGVTTLGMKEPEMMLIGHLIGQAIHRPSSQAPGVSKPVDDVLTLLRNHPLP